MSSIHVYESLDLIAFRKLNTQLKFPLSKCLKRILLITQDTCGACVAQR